jgi:hypothetical protein
MYALTDGPGVQFAAAATAMSNNSKIFLGDLLLPELAGIGFEGVDSDEKLEISYS